MRKYFALLTILVLLFLTTTGCIDLYLVNEFLVPRDDPPLEFVWQEYHYHYGFNSTPPAEILEVYNEQFELEIKPKTQQMRIDVTVDMRSAKEVEEIINDTLPEGDIKDAILEFLDQIFEYADQRYIEVTIKLPDGFEVYHNRFNQTAAVEIGPVLNPGEGTWIIEVDAAGIGGDVGGYRYQDSFSIDAIVKELKE
jgi:hypothetical protein